MSEDVGKPLKIIFPILMKDRYAVWFIRIGLLLLVVFLAIEVIAYERDGNKGKHVKLLWFERNIPEERNDTVTLTKTTYVHDTLKTIVHVPNSIKSNDPKRAPVNSQKIDSGSSGLQNNGTNYGNQAGRDMTINHFSPVQRMITDETLKYLFSNLPDKNQGVSIGRRTDDEESLNYTISIMNALKQAGYKHVYMNGVYNEIIISNDPQDNTKARSKFDIIPNPTLPSQLEVIIPVHPKD